MKISSLITPAALALLLLAACEQESKPRKIQNSAAQTGNNYGYQAATPGTATDFVTDATPTPTPEPKPDASPTPTPATASATPEHTLPYGTPVAGKPGFVTSPHAPYAGYVDVRGFPPNTEVKDPYSGKIFLVP
ncbi:MAG: hypothetical protein PHC88_14160 [Terrimicrobiaceae bacterium]|nr:hypothetical protein [Terrimicrobiaceae bacterium]